LAAGFWATNLALAQKIMALPESGGPPQSPVSYAYDDSIVIVIVIIKTLISSIMF